MTYDAIIYSKENHVAWITLDRPEAGNIVNPALAQEVAAACRQAAQDDDVYVLVITGSGSKAFCGGGEPGPQEQYCPAAAVAGIDRPVIAAINGDALGEGLELALAADIRITSEQAHLGLPQLAQGLIPTDGGTQRLPRIVGAAKAMELLLTTEAITAAEAFEIGLVDQVVPQPELAARARALAETMAAKGPIALRYIKEAVNKGLDLTLDQGLRLEADLYFLLHTTADRTEGIRAFMEKRPPEFKGK